MTIEGAVTRRRLSLRQMLAAGQCIRLFCSSCGRDRTVELALIVSPRDINGDMGLSQIERRIRCTRCNGKNVEMMTPSHSIIPTVDDRTKRISSNVQGVPCPKCGTIEVSRSPPLTRPFKALRSFLPGQLYDYECEACGNWWTSN